MSGQPKADSPEQKYGGFHIHAVTTAKNALKEIRRLRRALKWALGESGDFAQRPIGAGAYWWRTELRRRAGMSPNTERTDRRGGGSGRPVEDCGSCDKCGADRVPVWAALSDDGEWIGLCANCVNLVRQRTKLSDERPH